MPVSAADIGSGLGVMIVGSMRFIKRKYFLLELDFLTQLHYHTVVQHDRAYLFPN